jgi:hypothetical protein
MVLGWRSEMTYIRHSNPHVLQGIQNPTTEIEKMAVFLNVKNSTKFYGKVAESCSFEKLKQDLWKTRWP